MTISDNHRLPFADKTAKITNRRTFLAKSTTGLGALALASLFKENLFAADAKTSLHGALKSLDFAPKAKRVIYLFMSGAPSHIDLFDYKPKLKEMAGKDLPDSVRGAQRLTGFTRSQNSLPVIPSKFSFAQHGQSGTWLSELLPHTAKVVD